MFSLFVRLEPRKRFLRRETKNFNASGLERRRFWLSPDIEDGRAESRRRPPFLSPTNKFSRPSVFGLNFHRRDRTIRNSCPSSPASRPILIGCLGYCFRRTAVHVRPMREELHAQRGTDTPQADPFGTSALRMRSVLQAFRAKGPPEEARANARAEAAARPAAPPAALPVRRLLEETLATQRRPSGRALCQPKSCNRPFE